MIQEEALRNLFRPGGIVNLAWMVRLCLHTGTVSVSPLNVSGLDGCPNAFVPMPSMPRVSQDCPGCRLFTECDSHLKINTDSYILPGI